MRYLIACLILVGCAATTPVTCDPDGYLCRGTRLTNAELDTVCHNGVGADGVERVTSCDDGEAHCRQIDRDAAGVPYPGPVRAIVCDDAGRLSLK